MAAVSVSELPAPLSHGLVDGSRQQLGAQAHCAPWGGPPAHLFVHPSPLPLSPPPPADNSRLGCQVFAAAELDGMSVIMPKEVNNMMK